MSAQPDPLEKRGASDAHGLRVHVGLVLSFGALVTIPFLGNYFMPANTRPPHLTLKIGSASQESRYGDYTWRGLHSDAFQFVAPRTPLIARPQFTATLDQRTLLGRPDTCGCVLVEIELAKCFLTNPAADYTCWHALQDWEDGVKCSKLSGSDKVELQFDVTPGLYVLNVDTGWARYGGTVQAFLIEVRP